MKTHSTPARGSFAAPRPAWGRHLLALAALAGLGSVSHAANYVWTGAESTLLNTTANNWSPGAIPGAGDTITFDGTGNTSSSLRVGTGANPTFGGTTGLASLTVTSGQTSPLTFIGQATSGAATYRFDVNGTISIASGAGAFTLGTGTTNVTLALGGGASAAAGTLSLTNQSGNTASLASNVTINRGGTGSGSRGVAFGGSGNWNVAAAISNVDYLNKTGAGTLTFSGSTLATSLASGVNITGGTLHLTGFLLNPASAVAVGASGTLAGTGGIAGATRIDGTLAGRLSLSSTLTLGAGGRLNWQVLDAVSNFDTTTLSAGSLNLSELSAGNKFTINLWTLSSPGVNGPAANFDSSLDQSWVLIATPSAISGFSATYFDLNTGPANGTGGFANALNGGAFSVGLSQDGTDLLLHYTAAIPEPAHAALILGGACLALCGRRRASRPPLAGSR